MGRRKKGVGSAKQEKKTRKYLSGMYFVTGKHRNHVLTHYNLPNDYSQQWVYPQKVSGIEYQVGVPRTETN